MTDEARRKVVAQELELAAKALRETELLRGAGLVRGALSRLYFAGLHLAKALLASDGLEARSHRGVKSLVWTTFVQAGRLEPAHQQTLARLETWRDEADYERGFAEDPDLLKAEVEATEKLRRRVLELLRAAGFEGEG